MISNRASFLCGPVLEPFVMGKCAFTTLTRIDQIAAHIKMSSGGFVQALTLSGMP
ncbi:MAG: hypothetical protein AAGB07_10920 [Pseudomonadota bacterium]